MSPETRQQIIALVLGLVFIVGFVLFAQRLGQFLRERQKQAKVGSSSLSPTPTPTNPVVMVNPTTLPQVVQYNKQPERTPVVQRSGPATIPQTGPELSFFGVLATLLSGGFILRRLSQRS